MGTNDKLLIPLELTYHQGRNSNKIKETVNFFLGKIEETQKAIIEL
jgi:hypothetical protein